MTPRDALGCALYGRENWESMQPGQVFSHTDDGYVDRVLAGLSERGFSVVASPDDKAPSPALIQAAYIAQDDLSKPPPQWAISAASEIVDEYIRAQGNTSVRVLGHPVDSEGEWEDEMRRG